MTEVFVLATRHLTASAYYRYQRATGEVRPKGEVPGHGVIEEGFRQVAIASVFERLKEYSHWTTEIENVADYAEGVFGRNHPHLERLVEISEWIHFELFYILRNCMSGRSWNIWHVSSIGQDIKIETIGDYRIMVFELEHPEWQKSDKLVSDEQVYEKAIELLSRRR